MEIIKPGVSIDFMRYRAIGAALSGLIVLVSVILIAVKGFNYGIGFAGGVELRVEFKEKVSIGDVRRRLIDGGFKNVQVVSFLLENRTVYSIKAKGESSVTEALAGETEKSQESELPDVARVLMAQLQKDYGADRVEVISTDMVGPRVGESLRRKGVMAIVYALLGILVYIGWRFNFRYSPGAVVALAHDVIVVAGVFALLQLEIDLTVVAALLTVAGYSVNDTVIIFDRVREGHTVYRGKPIITIVNNSLNDTLSRTILTSGTTLIVVLAIYFLGSEIIKDFALAMSVGILVGTYSSLYIATPIYIALEEISIKRRRLARKKS
ncbi:MAG: protein translocase subunit SecF [Deltaproteobacteria bacterium]|nr:protein translocase subunit SecF [Deltaproteobacteria bacterium]